MAKKERIDVLLVENGFFETREKAKRAIMAGLVYIDEVKHDKPGEKVLLESNLIVRGNPMKYVSRGGLKLEKAMALYGLTLSDKICMDIGASTGGFTDCMLQNGATKVYSVDVGYGQLDWKLRNDDRVVNMERTNIRHVTDEQIEDKLDFVSIDVSFISLKLVLPVAHRLMADDGQIVFLIKPQFEAGKEFVGKNGVVKDPKVHKRVILELLTYAQENGFNYIGLSYSPIKGPKGNREFLAYFEKAPNGEQSVESNVNFESVAETIVKESHEVL